MIGVELPDGMSGKVSIQMISPASGDRGTKVILPNSPELGFHSNDIPSEWGLGGVYLHKLKEVEFPFK